MKKLAATVVNEDKFGPYIPEEELRKELKELLRQTSFTTAFPRKILSEMSLLEVMSLWNAAASRADASTNPALCIWLHKHLGMLVLACLELDRLAKRTTNILPVNYQNLHISDLVALGGSFNAAVLTPDGHAGIMHTIPRFSLKVVLDAGRTHLWYETA